MTPVEDMSLAVSEIISQGKTLTEEEREFVLSIDCSKTYKYWTMLEYELSLGYVFSKIDYDIIIDKLNKISRK